MKNKIDKCNWKQLMTWNYSLETKFNLKNLSSEQYLTKTSRIELIIEIDLKLSISKYLHFMNAPQVSAVLLSVNSFLRSSPPCGGICICFKDLLEMSLFKWPEFFRPYLSTVQDSVIKWINSIIQLCFYTSCLKRRFLTLSKRQSWI